MTPPSRWFARLRDVDAVFLALLKGMTDPESVPGALLAYPAHSAFRASASLSLTGQASESYMVLRGSLEHALYANHMALHPSTWKTWMKRGESEEARKACSREFSGRNILASADTRDAVLGKRLRGLYERSIDFGAHPNELAVGSTYSMSESDKELRFTSAYITGDPVVLELAQKSSVQAGLMVLDLLCHVFPKRAAEKDIQAKLVPLKVGV